MTRHWRRLLAAAAALAVLAGYTLYSSGSITHGFVAYYGAARLLVEGRLGPAAYDDEWFNQYVQDITDSSVREIFTPNPPTMALMALPVAGLRHPAARTMWLFASLTAFTLAVAALARYRATVPPGRGSASLIVVLVMLLNPAVFANLRTGQGYLLLFALFAAVVLCLLRGRDRWAGVCLGLLIALKTAGSALVLLLLVQRRWRVLVTAGAVAAALALSIAPFIDNRMWVEFPAQVQAFVQRPSGSVTAYQTTLGLFRRLCIADPVWNPSPAAAACGPVAFVLPWLLLGPAIVITMAAALRARERPAPVLAAAVCLSELTLPAAAEPHFVLLVLPLALLNPRPIAFAVVSALLLVPMDYTAEVFTSGWASLLAYPRLYATWLLWGLSIQEAIRHRA